jgi:hypothetical protein
VNLTYREALLRPGKKVPNRLKTVFERFKTFLQIRTLIETANGRKRQAVRDQRFETFEK